MSLWLTERGQKTEMPMAGMDMSNMKGMDMSHMHHDMPLMPGMLSPDQMKALAKAKGAKFDHLFLTGMIQHHQGALTMVEDLFDTPAAGQDAVLTVLTKPNARLGLIFLDVKRAADSVGRVI